MITAALDDLKKDKADDPNRINYTINAVAAISIHLPSRIPSRQAARTCRHTITMTTMHNTAAATTTAGGHRHFIAKSEIE